MAHMAHTKHPYNCGSPQHESINKSPLLYKIGSRHYDAIGKILDEHLAQIQGRLWQINDEKNSIHKLMSALDQRWQTLDQEGHQLESEYTQIQLYLGN